MTDFLDATGVSRKWQAIKKYFSYSNGTKTTPVDADCILMTDSADTESANGTTINKIKRVTFANLKAAIGSGGESAVDHTKAVLIESDFFNASVNAIPGILGVAISSGTVGVVASDANHPGAIYLRDSTTANGGYRFLTDISSFRITGGEVTEFVFKPVSVRAAASFRFGFQDSTAIQTAPTDGVFINVVGNATNPILSGKTRNNNTESVTGTTYTLTANTWYRAKIEVNADATLITFTLYSEAGTQLWQQTLSTNIPKTAGREVGWGIIAGETSTDAAADILHADYINLSVSRTLTR